MSEQSALEFGCLLRRLRTREQLTQDAVAEAATLSARTVSDLERGINRTAHKATAELLATALGLAGLERRSFIAAARGRQVPVGVETSGRHSSTFRSGTATDVLIGRDGEQAMLVRLMAEVAAGLGAAVLIEGEPGIGKSALVHAALAEAADLGCEAFWGAGDELGQALPLLPMLEALRVREQTADPRRNMIVRLLRGEGGVDRGMDVSAVLAEQLLALVAEQCAAAPTILVIDDLQWADQTSITLWRRLARSVRQLPLLLIGMMRPVPQREDLHALRRAAGDALRLRLTGLGQAAVTELVTSLAGARPDDKLLALAGGAAGNPLYVIELVDALARSSSLTVTSAGATVLANGSAPASLAAAIANRLGFVSSSVREVLRAAALLGVDFALPDLAVVLDRNMAGLFPAVDEARAAGVLAVSGGGFRFRHPLIRTALYEEIAVPVRAAWHREAGRALATAGAQADQVARQLLQAVGVPGVQAEPMADWAVTWLARSADLLVGQAPQAAVELLRRAVASPAAGLAHHDFIMARLADALYRVGEAVEAEQVASRVLARAVEPDLVVDLHWTLAQCRMRAGRFAESLATLEGALASPGISAVHRARLLTLAARTHCILSKPEKAGQVAATALEVASQAGDNWATGWALHVLAIATGVRGQMADALPLFDRALAVTEADLTLTDLRLLLQINKAVTLGDLDRYEEAIGTARQALQLADQAGMVIRQVQAHSVLGELFFDTGRWDEAMAEVEATQAEAKGPMTACCDLGVAAVIRFHRGEIPGARRTLAAAASNAERIGSQLIGPFVLARSLDHESAGAPAEALGVLTAWFTEDAEGLAEVEDLLPDAVRLATQTGDIGTARALAGHAAALAAGSEIPHRQANVLYCLGTLEHDAGKLVAAADRYRDAGRPLLSAKALEAAAGAFLTTGNRDQAWATADRAVEIYTLLSAATDIARLRAGGSYL
jgi:tetratricopeptide (TPR) repeat protein/transcriptional regulator with XRE-family HTH domain